PLDCARDPAIAQGLAGRVMNKLDAFHYICGYMHCVAVGVYSGNEYLNFDLHSAISDKCPALSIITRVKLDF
ncbi:hypothetical protein, partial [Psychrobacter sp. TB20-MNA-CIBAN-0197]|uniref:hypothetical protein n=1 Tax=Psychrobacter sp. TB20-MNA-CIBAN-0197 TaxID=3140453 RepID=UPI003316B7DC